MEHIHLGLFTMPPVTHHSLATWRVPRNASVHNLFGQDLWHEVGRLAERGGFDFVFAADTLGVFAEFEGSFDASLRGALQVPLFDATTFVTSVGAATRHIGVIATHSVFGTHPYALARKFSTLDHLTGGRAGWNVVTATHDNAYQNIGYDGRIGHAERYRILNESVDAVRALWESWDADAVLLDKENAVFADPSKVHAVDFHGEFFRSRGPLTLPRTPQRHPVLVQAGASADGRRAAARFAEAVFSIKTTRQEMKEYRDDLRRLATEEHGRDPDTLKIFHSIQPFVGETRQIAQAKREYHNSLVPQEAGLALLSGHLGLDLSQYSPNDPVTVLREGERERSTAEAAIAFARTQEGGEELTLGEVGRLYGRNVLSPQITGTAEDIADWIEETVADVGGDGFMISPAWLPGSLADFVELVVPELRRRGRVRTTYPEGATLRDLLAGAGL